MVQREFKGSAFYVGEVSVDFMGDIEELEQDQLFESNVAFLMSQKFSLKIMRRILLSRKIGTAILSFDTPTAPDEMLSPLPGQTHSSFIGGLSPIQRDCPGSRVSLGSDRGRGYLLGNNCWPRPSDRNAAFQSVSESGISATMCR